MPRCDLSTHALRSWRCGRYGGTRTATAAGRWTSPSSTSSCALCRSRSRSSECLPLQRACRLPDPSRMHITIPARAAACTQPPVPRRSMYLDFGGLFTAQHWAGGVPYRSRLRSFLRRCRCKLGPRRRAPPRLHGLLRRAVLSLAVHRSSRSRQSLWSGWRCTARCRTFIRRLRGISRTRCAACFPT
jgi:hypothetical protein